MKVHMAKDNEDIVESIIAMMEKDTGKKVLTVEVLGECEHDENAIDVMVIFADKSIMVGHLIAQIILGKMAIRVQGDFING